MSKRILFTMMFLGLCCFFAGNALAAPPYTNTAGAELTISDSDQDMTYQPSPGVLLAVYTSDTAYSIVATNDSANDDDQMQYGIISTMAGYYQEVNSTLDTLASAAHSFSDWTYMGGS